MSSERKELTMTFDPRTIEHLGIKMYSRLPNAIAELVANAYDACANKILIRIIDDRDGKKVMVEDNGDGMSFDEINSKFLVIGRNRRKEGESVSSCGRVATGKKGLGKLALFGIGKTIVIETCKDNIETVFTLDWDELLQTPGGKPYKPEYKVAECNGGKNGTRITLTNLKRKSDFDISGLSISLAKLFDFLDSLVVLLQFNEEEAIRITDKLRYENITEEFKWSLPDWLEQEGLTDYENYEGIKGKIITTEKPLKPGMRGITLFANGRMVNHPEFFDSSESSHFFSYVTGWLDVDFVDNWEQDVISTNRQSLSWETPETSKLRTFLTKILTEIHKDWRKKRKIKKIKSINERTTVDIEKWYSETPEPIRIKIEPVIEKIVEDAELTESETNLIVVKLHELLPEYTYYHYRNLHPEIAEVSRSYYENKNYYGAVFESIKRYVKRVREKSGIDDDSEFQIVSKAFGENKVLKTTSKYKRPDGSDFKKSTKENIEEGQKFLSMGVVKGARHPVAHEEIEDLRTSGLFSEKDCLDMLSTVSHLMRRLDDSKKDG